MAVHGPAQTPPPDDAHAPWSEGSVMDTISREPAISPTDTGAATFTKWMVGEGPEMAGTVGGSVGDGTYQGKVLEMNVGPTTTVEALYGFHGSEQDVHRARPRRADRSGGRDQRRGDRRLREGPAGQRFVLGDPVRPRRRDDRLLAGPCRDGYPARGRLAQLVRAPRLHRGSHWFESSTAHHVSWPLWVG